MVYLVDMDIELAVYLLKKGEPVAIPTETVYGLAAPIFLQEAVKKIFSLKGRPSDNPLIAHVSSLAMVRTIAEHIPDSFHLLASRFWPGPLTLVLPKHPSVPSLVSAGHPTIAVRMPSHPIALRLIELTGQPLVAPSANLSGKPSPTCAEHVREDFGDRLPIIDGGPCAFGIESTVLSLVHPVPTLLRPGSISRQELESVIGPIQEWQKDQPILSPGMKYRHYAPKATIQIHTDPKQIKGPFVLSHDLIAPFHHRPLNAKTFYHFLREADQNEVKLIEIYLDPLTSSDEAFMNRLLRAAGLS